MEDIFEELASVSDDEGRAEENDQGGSGNREDEAEEANDTRRVVKPKRVIVRQPRPKLDPTRLLGPRGIFTIKSTFDNVKFKGKGHELDDLNNVLSRLQHWAHRLFPKMTFEDCIDRIEDLGNKKEIQVNMHKIRNGMIDLDSGQPSQDNDVPDSDRVPTPPPDDNAFDQLIATVPAAPQATLTDEQRARMMRNRLLAEERRMARRLAWEKELENQRQTGNKASGESGTISTNTSTILASAANKAVSPTHSIPGTSASDLQSAEVSIRSKDFIPSCVFDEPALEPNTTPNLNFNEDSRRSALNDAPMEQSSDGSANTTAATGGEEETRVLCSDAARGHADATVCLPNDQIRSQDPQTIFLDSAIKLPTAAMMDDTTMVLGNDSSPSNVDVLDGKTRPQDSSVASPQSANELPITDGTLTTATAVEQGTKVACSDSPSKANSGPDPDHHATTPDSRLEISESDLMDVEHTPEPSSHGTKVSVLCTAEDHRVESPPAKVQMATSQSLTPKPAVEELMDVGSAEGWEEAFAEEERAMASQNPP